MSYIHVDSRYRIKEPSVTYQSIYQLPDDPIYLSTDSTLAIIKCSNCLTEYDRVSLTGINVPTINTQMSIKYLSRYAVITHHSHGMTGHNAIPTNYIEVLPGMFRPSEVIPDSEQLYVYPTEFTVEISGAYEGIHSVYVIDEDTYAISLPLIANQNQKLNVSVKLNHLWGISVDVWSQVLPIYSRTDETITVNIGQANTTSWVGGSNVTLAHVASYEPGYPYPYDYVYYFNKAYTDISSVQIISSVFPNTQYVINDDANTLILEDSDGVKELVIQPGNYDLPSISKELSKYLTTTFTKTKLTLSYWQEIDTTLTLVSDQIISDNELVYYNGVMYKNGVLSDIGVVADFGLNTPEQLITYKASTTDSLKPFDYYVTDTIADTVQVYQIDELLQPVLSNDTIQFDNWLVSNGVITNVPLPVSKDHTHTLIQTDKPIADHVKTDKQYSIIRGWDNKYLVKGLLSGKLLVPRLFRLLDSELKTILGMPSDISYRYSVTNDKPIQLSGLPYLYVCCEQLKAIDSPIQDVFTIIKRREDPERVLADQHIPVKIELNGITLDRLHIRLLTPSGDPVIMSEDHSFTLLVS